MRESDRQPVIIANHEIAPACVVTLKPLPYQRCFSSPDCCQTSKSQKAVIPAMIVLHQLELAGTVLGERRFRVGSKTEVPGFARHIRLTLRSRHPQPAPACPLGAITGPTRRLSKCAKVSALYFGPDRLVHSMT